MPTASSYDPTRTALNGTAAIGRRSARSAASACASTATSASRRPGFDINDVGFLQRADQRKMSNWIQLRNERPSKYLRSFRFNLNQWAGWNFDGDRLFSGGNVNAHAMFTNHWATGIGVQPQSRSRSTTGRRAAGRACSGNAASAAIWALCQERRAQAVSVNVFTFVGKDGRGHDATWEISPTLSLAPVVVPDGQRRRLLQPQRRRIAVGREHRRRALRLRAARSAARSRSRRG